MYKDVTLMARIDNEHEIYQTEIVHSIDISQPLSDKDIVDIVKIFEKACRAKCTYFHVADIEFDEAINKGYIIYDEKNEETIYLNEMYRYVEWSFTEDEIKQAFDNVANSDEED